MTFNAHIAAAWVALFTADREERQHALRLYLPTDTAAAQLDELLSTFANVADAHRLIGEHGDRVADACVCAGRWLLPSLAHDVQAKLAADLSTAEAMV